MQKPRQNGNLRSLVDSLRTPCGFYLLYIPKCGHFSTSSSFSSWGCILYYKTSLWQFFEDVIFTLLFITYLLKKYCDTNICLFIKPQNIFLKISHYKLAIVHVISRQKLGNPPQNNEKKQTCSNFANCFAIKTNSWRKFLNFCPNHVIVHQKNRLHAISL